MCKKTAHMTLTFTVSSQHRRRTRFDTVSFETTDFCSLMQLGSFYDQIWPNLKVLLGEISASKDGRDLSETLANANLPQLAPTCKSSSDAFSRSGSFVVGIITLH